MLRGRRRNSPRITAPTAPPTDVPDELLPAVDDPVAIKALAEADAKKYSGVVALGRDLVAVIDRCSVDTLLELFADSLEEPVARGMLQNEVVAALGRRGDRRAVRPLLDAFQVPNPRTRGVVGASLGQLGGPEVIDAMLALLAGGDSASIQVLGVFGDDPRVVPALIECLEQRGWAEAASQLGHQGDLRAVPALCQRLHPIDQDTDRDDLAHQTAVAQALGRLGDPRAVPALCTRLRPIDQDMENDALSHQSVVARALVSIGDRAALPALRAVDLGTVSRATMDGARAADDGAWQWFLSVRQGIHDDVVALKHSPRRRPRGQDTAAKYS